MLFESLYLSLIMEAFLTRLPSFWIQFYISISITFILLVRITEKCIRVSEVCNPQFRQLPLMVGQKKTFYVLRFSIIIINWQSVPVVYR